MIIIIIIIWAYAAFVYFYFMHAVLMEESLFSATASSGAVGHSRAKWAVFIPFVAHIQG